MAYLCVLILLSMAAVSPTLAAPFASTRASYYQAPDGQGTPSGACGLGEYGRKINRGGVTAVSNRLYNDGIGCGFCYQIRCKDGTYCRKEGTKVMVTDHGEGDNTDFILSHTAYSEMARSKAAARHLLAAGVVAVEYRRVPCSLPHHSNIIVRMDKKNSKLPDYFAALVLYLGRHGSLQGASMVTEDSDMRKKKITPMRRAYGAVWDLAHPNISPIMVLNISKRAGFQTQYINIQINGTSAYYE